MLHFFIFFVAHSRLFCLLFFILIFFSVCGEKCLSTTRKESTKLLIKLNKQSNSNTSTTASLLSPHALSTLSRTLLFRSLSTALLLSCSPSGAFLSLSYFPFFFNLKRCAQKWQHPSSPVLRKVILSLWSFVSPFFLHPSPFTPSPPFVPRSSLPFSSTLLPSAGFRAHKECTHIAPLAHKTRRNGFHKYGEHAQQH